jgi:hypothetical protein
MVCSDTCLKQAAVLETPFPFLLPFPGMLFGTACCATQQDQCHNDTASSKQ